MYDTITLVGTLIIPFHHKIIIIFQLCINGNVRTEKDVHFLFILLLANNIYEWHSCFCISSRMCLCTRPYTVHFITYIFRIYTANNTRIIINNTKIIIRRKKYIKKCGRYAVRFPGTCGVRAMFMTSAFDHPQCSNRSVNQWSRPSIINQVPTKL